MVSARGLAAAALALTFLAALSMLVLQPMWISKSLEPGVPPSLADGVLSTDLQSSLRTWSTLREELNERRRGQSLAPVQDRAVSSVPMAALASKSSRSSASSDDLPSFERATWRLSEPRVAPASTSLGPLFLFAGGGTRRLRDSDRIDAFDAATGRLLTSAPLVEARRHIAAASSQTFAAFAGGTSKRTGLMSNAVEIYHLGRGWSKHRLSVGRTFVAATATRDAVFFAGGTTVRGGGVGGTRWSDAVDVFRLSTVASASSKSSSSSSPPPWSVTRDGDSLEDHLPAKVAQSLLVHTTFKLSIARTKLAAATAGGRYVLFAGGFGYGKYMKKMDVFDTETWKWSRQSVQLSEARQWVTGASDSHGRAYFAGGFTCEECAHQDRSAKVDVFTVSASTGKLVASALNLGQARSNMGSAFAGGYAIFAGGNARMPAEELLENAKCRSNCRGHLESGAMDPDDPLDANPRNKVSIPPGFTLKGKPAKPSWPLGMKGHRVDAFCGSGGTRTGTELALLPGRASPGVAAHAFRNGSVFVVVAGGEARTKWRVPMRDGLISDYVLDRVDVALLPPCEGKSKH